MLPELTVPFLLDQQIFLSMTDGHYQPDYIQRYLFVFIVQLDYK